MNPPPQSDCDARPAQSDCYGGQRGQATNRTCRKEIRFDYCAAPTLDVAQVRHLECLGQSLLLHGGGEGEWADFVALEDVQAPVEADFPASVGRDAPGMELVAVVVLVFDAHS